MNKQSIIDRIKTLKEEKNAVIVAHTYQNEEIYQIADIVGDSYALSKYCATKDCDIIVFCGVHFMAESAKILSPEKKVLLPEITAGCPMADMVTAEDLRDFKKNYPEAKVVTYINSSAAVKAESDVIVTSSNALRVVNAMKDKQIIFCPDKNLGSYVAKKCKDKEVILWKGFCPTHNLITEEEVLAIKSMHPEAILLVHPECTEDVLKHADYIGSTKEIIDYAEQTDAKEIIIGTEMGVMYPLKRDNPNKKFYILSTGLVCKDMKITTLESVLNCLENEQYEITVPEEVAAKAGIALNKMLELAK